MLNFYDIAYGLGVGVSSPFWLAKTGSRRKVVRAFSERMGHVTPCPDSTPAVLIHAVSLGEMNATRGLVTRLRQLRPEVRIIISATTDTGYARGLELYGKPKPGEPPITVIHYPLDFTSAIARVLDGLRPSAVVLMELEVWPNFLLQCHNRGIPVLLVNGRITEPSYRRYRLVSPVIRRMFRRLAVACVQDEVNAQRFKDLGVPEARLRITGTMKFDTATVAERVAGDDALAAAVGLKPWFTDSPEPIWLCGSTGPGEETLVLQQYRQLLTRHPRLRLVIVPRKPERFNEVADTIKSAGFELLRRSAPTAAPPAGSPVILGDTMGELRKFYSLCDVVFVGRTLVDLGPRQHGSDMIEPAALAKPVLVGPFTGNFADAMSGFRKAGAMLEITTADALGREVDALLSDPARRHDLGRRAQQVVEAGKGATERHIAVVMEHLPK